MIHFELFFRCRKVWVESVLFYFGLFCPWIVNWYTTSYWKRLFFKNWFGENQLFIRCGSIIGLCIIMLTYLLITMPLPCSLDNCRVIISLEKKVVLVIQLCLFSKLFGYCRLLHFHMNFTINLNRMLIKIALNAYINLKVKWHLNNIESSDPWTWYIWFPLVILLYVDLSYLLLNWFISNSYFFH